MVELTVQSEIMNHVSSTNQMLDKSAFLTALKKAQKKQRPVVFCVPTDQPLQKSVIDTYMSNADGATEQGDTTIFQNQVGDTVTINTASHMVVINASSGVTTPLKLLGAKPVSDGTVFYAETNHATPPSPPPSPTSLELTPPPSPQLAPPAQFRGFADYCM